MIEARKELALLLGWIPVSLLGVSLLSALAIHLILPLLSGAVTLVPLLRLCQYALPALGGGVHSDCSDSPSSLRLGDVSRSYYV